MRREDDDDDEQGGYLTEDDRLYKLIHDAEYRQQEIIKRQKEIEEYKSLDFMKRTFKDMFEPPPIPEHFEIIQSLINIIEMAKREGWDIPFSKSQELNRAKTYIGIRNDND